MLVQPSAPRFFGDSPSEGGGPLFWIVCVIAGTGLVRLGLPLLYLGLGLNDTPYSPDSICRLSLPSTPASGPLQPLTFSPPYSDER